MTKGCQPLWQPRVISKLKNVSDQTAFEISILSLPVIPPSLKWEKHEILNHSLVSANHELILIIKEQGFFLKCRIQVQKQNKASQKCVADARPTVANLISYIRRNRKVGEHVSFWSNFDLMFVWRAQWNHSCSSFHKAAYPQLVAINNSDLCFYRKHRALLCDICTALHARSLPVYMTVCNVEVISFLFLRVRKIYTLRQRNCAMLA